MSADRMVKYSRLAESTNLACLIFFVKQMRLYFEGEWLRLSNKEKLKVLSHEFSRLGFPGCIGSVDCESWYWDLCPVGLHGQCSSKKLPSPNVRMDVVCDDFLRIWFINFGAPGAKNNCQIYAKSELFNKIRTAE